MDASHLEPKGEMRVNKQETDDQRKNAHNIIPNPSQDNVPIHTQPLVGGKALCPRPTDGPFPS